MILTGTHKTKCMVCGKSDNLVMQYDGKKQIDLCYECAITGSKIADRNTMIFITNYVQNMRKTNPGCHYGSEFSDECIDKFEEMVWLGFLRGWIYTIKKRN